jgi:hypothetical protein
MSVAAMQLTLMTPLPDPGPNDSQGYSSSTSGYSSSQSVSILDARCRENQRVLDLARRALVGKMGEEPLGYPVPSWMTSDEQSEVRSKRQEYADQRFRQFEDRQMGYMWRKCINCLEVLMCNSQDHDDARGWMSGSLQCPRCRSKTASKVWAHSNNTCPGNVPEELKHLSEIEEILIARIAPLIPCTVLKGGVTQLTGHTCGYYQDARPMLDVLPRIPSEVEVVSH